MYSAKAQLKAIFLISDTGYILNERVDVQKTRRDTFKKQESSGMKVGFFFFRDWPDNNYFVNDCIAVQCFITTGGE